jgi:hypothetical protein
VSQFPFGPTAKSALLAGLKHPIFISLFSAAMASIIIPGIVARSNAKAVLAKARIDHALEMMKASDSVNTALNKIKSELESFEKGSLEAPAEEYNKRRVEAGARIATYQSQLDDNAWTWTWGGSFRARVLKLISDADFKELESYNWCYSENVKATSALLDPPRLAYTKANAAQPPPGMPAIMPGVDKQLRDLQSRRDELVRKMIAIFQSEPRLPFDPSKYKCDN